MAALPLVQELVYAFSKPTMQSHFDFVIIGGGIAGVTCCEQLIGIYNDKKIHKSIRVFHLTLCFHEM